MKDGRKSLNPQAADYYKRLILVTDRYLVLLKKYRTARVIKWMAILITLANVTILLNQARALHPGLDQLLSQLGL